MNTKRGLVLEALKEELKKISKANGFNLDLYGNVKKRFIFPSDDPELPIVCLTAGSESITYQPGGPQDRYLTVVVRFYVESQDDIVDKQEKIIQDIEKVVDSSSRLVLGDGTITRDIKIQLIDTDQGILAPLGTGEIQLIVEY